MIVRPGKVVACGRTTKRERSIDLELPRAANATGLMPKVVVRLDEEAARQLRDDLEHHLWHLFGVPRP